MACLSWSDGSAHSKMLAADLVAVWRVRRGPPAAAPLGVGALLAGAPRAGLATVFAMVAVPTALPVFAGLAGLARGAVLAVLAVRAVLAVLAVLAGLAGLAMPTPVSVPVCIDRGGIPTVGPPLAPPLAVAAIAFALRCHHASRWGYHFRCRELSLIHI